MIYVLFSGTLHDNVLHPAILTDIQRGRNSAEWANNENGRLTPEGIASVSLVFLNLHIDFDDNQQAYHYLVNQDRSAWTWELDRELAW